MIVQRIRTGNSELERVISRRMTEWQEANFGGGNDSVGKPVDKTKTLLRISYTTSAVTWSEWEPANPM